MAADVATDTDGKSAEEALSLDTDETGAFRLENDLIIKLKDIYEGMAKVMEKNNDVGHALTDISRNHA